MIFNFKNRIALHYMLATALIMASVFGLVYAIVESTVYKHLDSDLSYEANKHIDEIAIFGDSIRFVNKAEWEEREHREAQVNPVFLQVINQHGALMDKSPNLKGGSLPFRLDGSSVFFDAMLQGKAIREAQIMVEKEGEVRGYILAAMSSESSQAVINQLRKVLIVSYCFILIGLYFTSRFLAGRSIVPVKQITETVKRISQRNLDERVALPTNRDELFDLATSFNALLTRISLAMERERQFTSDASHELRTPLATLRGTLEVLVRKPRTQEEYEAKIQYSLSEIDRMTGIIEQLLLLARLDTATDTENNQSLLPIEHLIDGVLMRYKQSIATKGLRVSVNSNLTEARRVAAYHAQLLFDNIIGNAIKYAKADTLLAISVSMQDNHLVCEVQDQGIGIQQEDMDKLFQPFFRSNALAHKHIQGNGLGLSIAKKSAEAMGATLSISSKLEEGTCVRIVF